MAIMNEPDSFTAPGDARGAFERDGVVCLRGVIDERWLELTRAGIARNIANPGRFFRDQTPDGSPARYLFDYWNWPAVPEFRELVLESGIAGIVARLTGAPSLTLLMDNWFLREAGAANGAPWHHDETYFDFFGGRKTVLWYPLEAASRDEGLTFLAGSHRWGKVYMAQNFREHRAFDGDLAGYHEIEDFTGWQESYLSWSLVPGDCLVFDFRTLHRATNGRDPLPRTIHRMSLRYGDGDVVFRPRGAWTVETSDYLRELGQRVDAPLDCPLLPRVWPRSDADRSGTTAAGPVARGA